MHASGLAVDPAGFLMIDSNLQSISATAVFAAGDCAVMHPRDYPKSGVYAVRQGSPLARNLRSTLTNNSLSPYRPQARALALISTGDKRAVLSYGPLALEGAWVWRWKDGIDRTFVRRYRMSL
jgi:selenide,water dikinase